MSGLLRTARCVVVLAVVGVSACGAPVVPAGVGVGDDPCAGLTALAGRPAHPALDAAWAAVADGRWDDAVTAGRAFDEALRRQAVGVFHDGQRTAEARRAFFDEWVFVDPPVLVVGPDRFLYSAPLGAGFVYAASRAGDPAAAAFWVEASAFDGLTERRARACIEGSTP